MTVLRVKARMAEAEAIRPELPLTTRIGVVLVVAAALVAYPLVLTSAFWLNLGVLALTFAIAAAAWNVLGGFTGQVSFGNAAFFGTGSYATALMVRAGWSPWLSMLVGAVLAVGIGLLIGLPCFRLRSHYFAIATIAVGVITQLVVNSNKSLGASAGLDIPLRSYSLAHLEFSTRNPTPYYYVVLALFALVSIAVWFLVRGRMGSYMRSIRDDEDAAAAAGVPVWRYKLVAIGVSGAMTAVAGSFYAMYVLFVDPSLVLDLTVSIDIVLMTVLGGAGALWGPLIGAWLLTLLQEYTRQEFGATAGLDLLVFGLLIVIVVSVEPGGLMALGRRLLAHWQARRRRRAAPKEAAS